MADEALRAAERRARETGELADAARLLLERVRCGDLQAGALSLAAYLGDPAAGAALGVRLELDEADEIAVTRWSRGLVAWGWPVYGRALFAAVIAELEATPGLDPTGEVLGALGAYWDEQAESRRREFQVGGDGLPHRRIVKCAAVAAYHWETPPGPGSRDLPPLLGIPMTANRLRPRLVPWAFATGDRLSGPTGTDLVRQAIDAGTPPSQVEMADRFRGLLGREVIVGRRSSSSELRFVPREVNDAYTRGEVPGEGHHSMRMWSITSVREVDSPP